MKTEVHSNRRAFIVIPCLNEVEHIEALLVDLRYALDEQISHIVVVDGGSEDGTVDVVARLRNDEPRIMLLNNPARIQSAGVNLAVRCFGNGFDYFIRIDAHGRYPPDYCKRLIEEAEVTGADSVVVAMDTVGFGLVQRATASAQNSRLGNGGSKHRGNTNGHWTRHGHHALMRVASFEAIGGYDETFSHNEDAELDFRLEKAGFRIWMTDKTRMIYYPRATVGSLFLQYLYYGRGRARNILKHRRLPNPRQMLPLVVLPTVIGASLAVLHWMAAVPLVLWALVCVCYGFWMAVRRGNPSGPLAGLAAMVMHFAWSTGFWMELLTFFKRRRLP
ncbi:glycosyltransferase family 2 protein [Rhizobium sp. BR 362]|uniref:glycosyltransferase family 2 protein n=1 Tax=Rhizobium sp. BR 362 TaxID=3040670 RepID=UPI002F417963